MKILIAPDSFKGSMSALRAAQSIEQGVKSAVTEVETVLLPMADGGEGTVETLVASTDGTTYEIPVTGPLGEEVLASYGVLGDGQTCIIEMATASGLDHIPDGHLSPLTTTTYGTGELIKHALDADYTSFIIGLGGSATNDGGAGMLQALGLKIYDENGNEIGFGGGELEKSASIDPSSFDNRIKDCTFIIASDVENPLIGENGASYVFGPQKGATPEEVEYLDAGMKKWADVIEKTTQVALHHLPGAGAAGGIGGAFYAFFPTEFKRGIDVVLEFSKMSEHLKDADLVITGEGKIDYQSLSGKTPFGVALAAKKENVPTIIIAGSIGEGTDGLYEHGVVSIHSIMNAPCTLNEAMENASSLLSFTSEQVVRCFFGGCRSELEKILGGGEISW